MSGSGDALCRIGPPVAGERAGEPAVRIEVDLELGVVVLVGVGRGLEHRGRVGGAEAAHELGDAGALAVGEEREPAAERDEVMVRADERVDLGLGEGLLADADLTREDEVGDVEAGRAAAHLVLAGGGVAPPEVRREHDRDAGVHELGRRGLDESDDVVERERTSDRFVILERRPRPLRRGPLGLDERGDRRDRYLELIGDRLEREPFDLRVDVRLEIGVELRERVRGAEGLEPVVVLGRRPDGRAPPSRRLPGGRGGSARARSRRRSPRGAARGARPRQRRAVTRSAHRV